MTSTEDHSHAISFIDAILAAPSTFVLPHDEGSTRALFLRLALYARYLSNIAQQSQMSSSSVIPAKRQREELEGIAERLRKAAQAGIKKQMTWKSACKNGSAKWSYDGVCTDPEVFGVMLGLETPPSWKYTKLPKDDFETLIGRCTGHLKYETLYITSPEVEVRWSDSGEFSFSGTYGKLQP